LRALRAVARLGIGLPLVAAGGIYRADDARLCLELGAVAVQVRGLVWSDPAAAARLAAELRPPSGPQYHSSKPTAKATE
jgi:dihydroorotate dehydrogenase